MSKQMSRQFLGPEEGGGGGVIDCSPMKSREAGQPESRQARQPGRPEEAARVAGSGRGVGPAHEAQCQRRHQGLEAERLKRQRRLRKCCGFFNAERALADRKALGRRPSAQRKRFTQRARAQAYLPRISRGGGSLLRRDSLFFSVCL